MIANETKTSALLNATLHSLFTHEGKAIDAITRKQAKEKRAREPRRPRKRREKKEAKAKKKKGANLKQKASKAYLYRENYNSWKPQNKQRSILC